MARRSGYFLYKLYGALAFVVLLLAIILVEYLLGVEITQKLVKLDAVLLIPLGFAASFGLAIRGINRLNGKQAERRRS